MAHNLQKVQNRVNANHVIFHLELPGFPCKILIVSTPDYCFHILLFTKIMYLAQEKISIVDMIG